jgi:outer membrane receptor for ferric coprogen and ferric-rhodotorulic acid
VRQALSRFYDPFEGISVGANATFINSRVYLPADESAGFGAPNVNAPISSRDMTNAPDHLFNFYTTYDLLESGTQFSVFYTVQGDTLIQGAGISNLSFVPSIYSKEYGTLNFAVSQQLTPRLRLMFQAKNVINPKIETVYRSPYIGGDQTQSTYRRGTELSLSLTATF